MTTGILHDSENILGTSLEIQWLRLPTSAAEGMGLIPAGELRFPLICCVVWPKNYSKERKYIRHEKKLAGRIHLSISSW